MRRILLRCLHLLSCASASVALATLVACGGGGGGGSSTPPPPPPTDHAPVADAGAAQTVPQGADVALDGSASSDPDNDPITYTWTLTTRPAGSATTLAGASTAKPTFTPDVPGTYVASLVVNDGQLNSPTATVTITAVPIESLTIVTDKQEPLSGTVQLSLSGPVAGATLSWFIDLVEIGTGLGNHNLQVLWDTKSATNAPHEILARVQVSPEKYYDIHRTVNVSNSDISVYVTVNGTFGTINVDVAAGAPSGIASVSGQFDGVPVGTLTSPNACENGEFCPPYDLYRFPVDGLAAGSGSHTMLITVVDGAGDTQQTSVPVPIANLPNLVVTSPADGAFVYGTLHVTGTVSSDEPGPISVTATLGELQILQMSGPSFDGSYDLTGLPAGSYWLYVTATDSVGTRSGVAYQVIVTSCAALAYTPVMTVGSGGAVLAADGDLVLYRAGDQSVRIHDTVAGTETVLQGTAPLGLVYQWQLDAGRAYVSALDPADCTSTQTCIYQWLPDGTRHNLTAGNPWANLGNQSDLVAHDGQVLWSNYNSLTLYDATAATYTQIALPAGANYVSDDDDVVAAGGQVYAFYVAQTGGSGSSSLYDVFQWSSGTGASTKLSTPGHISGGPLSDGVRVAWYDVLPNAPAGSRATLLSQVIGTPGVTTVSTALGNFALRDGVLAWSDLPSGSQDLKASTLSATTTLSILQGSLLLGTGGGDVAYTDSGKTWSWDSATGQTTLRLDVPPPSYVLVTQGWMYFVAGGNNVLYKVSLN
jgi:hypothetical protein